MKNIHLLIDTISSGSGSMPSKEIVLDSLRKEPSSRTIVKAIEDGDVILTGTRSREGIWAYQKSALTSGGMVVTSQGIERMTPQQLQQRLQGS